jgi:ATPase family associated with various cellular activities (AAA)
MSRSNKKTKEVKPHILPTGDKYYEASQSQNHFPVGVYFFNKFGTAPCTFDTDREVTKDIIPFLEKNGELVYEHTHMPSINSAASAVYDTGNYWDESEISENKVFAYKETIVYLRTVSSRRIKKEESHYSICISYKPGSPSYVEDFEKFFVKEEVKNVIFTIMKDEHGGVRFDPFEVEIPKTYSIKESYEPEFEQVHNRLVESLNKNESGLYLFHGDPGTGKTTYIKYLSSLLKRDMIYVPTSFVDYIADPAFLPALLHKKQSILIIEDAEKALLAREPGDTSSIVSTILNITDGIMANVFNIAVIATYNSPRQSVDKALLRKGRLKGEYRFDKLKVETAQKIVNKVKKGYKVDEPMSLADIYNLDVIETDTTKELTEEKRMGFR